MSNGFSGRTMGALSLMDKQKYRDGYEPFLPGFDSIEFNNVNQLKEKINDQTAAVFLEFIQGEGGIVGASTEFVKTLSDLRNTFGFLIVADEIQSGIGRTGKLFGYQHFSIIPDIVTVAKPIGGGLPLGAIIGNKKVAEVWTYGVHGTTFGGNPVACAAGLAVLNTVLTDTFIAQVNKNTEYFNNKLNDLKGNLNIIKDVRMFGYMIGVELNRDSASYVETMLSNNVLVNSTANSVIRILPPLIAGREEIDITLNVLENALAS